MTYGFEKHKQKEKRGITMIDFKNGSVFKLKKVTGDSVEKDISELQSLCSHA